MTIRAIIHVMFFEGETQEYVNFQTSVKKGTMILFSSCFVVVVRIRNCKAISTSLLWRKTSVNHRDVT